MLDKELFFSGNIYTVSSLTKEIKTLLEERYPFIWVTGEISNYALPSSGHAYFSLKDSDSLINCVMFKNQAKRLGFNIGNGVNITGIARISIYEPRGTYQLIFEHIEAKGTGDLQIRFERLKRELLTEGLFDESHKKKLPFLPSTLWVITSVTGAVIRDIIDVAQRRFPKVNIKIVPVRVQGEGADIDIKEAIELVNKIAINYNQDTNTTNSKIEAEPEPIIIIARGGGSLEDLSPFNSELVARAVFESEIPIISAVGHETDFTICDFVADIRAATPSVAAEIALPDYYSIKKSLYSLQNRLKESLKHHLTSLKKENQRLTESLNRSILNIMQQQKAKISKAISQLKALSPMAVLERGYSITKLCDNETNLCDNGKILIDANEVVEGDIIDIILSRGRLKCKVQEVNRI
ncbi:MAG: exodeoxyribonuclease VII large subunit [Desulfamplus sp.]|nr:exodeoxyribonuclease VII large subunit [Desulfamplus sp.]